MKITCLLWALALGITGAFSQDTPVAFINAQIYPIEGAPIPNGTLVIHKGKITAIGDASTPIPAGAKLTDTGRLIFPRALIEDTIANAARHFVLA